MIALTFSTDWCPPEVLQYTLDILDEYGVPATFFCTNDLSVTTFPGSKVQHELALHPNYDSSCPCGPTSDLLKQFPGAIGSRSHRFALSSPILRKLERLGLKYDSSVSTYMHYVSPYRQLNSIVELPVFWSDDIALLKGQVSYDIISAISCDGYPVLNFHPIHIYLNANEYAQYERAKPYYHRPDKLGRLRSRAFGTEDALRLVLRKNTDFMTCRGVYNGRTFSD